MVSNIGIIDTNKKGNKKLLFFFFFFSITIILLLFYYLLSNSSFPSIPFPHGLNDVKTINSILSTYKDDHYIIVFTIFCMSYIFLQTFAIPGPVFLSVLAGSLYNTFIGLVICATFGACSCYFLSNFLGRDIVQHFFPQLLHRFQQMIIRHRHNLFFYLLFLRITPLLPNWFINVSSPILQVPLSQFALATFLGLIPLNYLHVTTGRKLSQVDSMASLFDLKIFSWLMFLGLLSLIPTLFRRQLENLGGLDKIKNTPNNDEIIEQNTTIKQKQQ